MDFLVDKNTVFRRVSGRGLIGRHDRGNLRGLKVWSIEACSKNPSKNSVFIYKNNLFQRFFEKN